MLALGAYGYHQMTRLCTVALTLLFMFGCSRSGAIERRIGEHIDACQSDSPCMVRIQELTTFEWDRMYVFSYGVSHPYVESALGTRFPDYVEFKRRLVFLKGGSIVHREEEPTDIERMVDGEVSFAGLDTQPSHLSFTPSDAVFIATRQTHSRGVAYTLTQVR